ncbi:Nn.00g014630.m01.CDS01 [Neocucurbitaria sp. VM-36]
MLPRPSARYYLKPTILYLSSPEDLAWPGSSPKRTKSKTKAKTPEPKPELVPAPDMADTAKNTINNATGNAPGGRGLGEVGDSIGAIAKTPGVAGTDQKGGNKTKDTDEGFGLDNKDVKGSLKIHIKLDLEADIRVIARIKGDIAIGLL